MICFVYKKKKSYTARKVALVFLIEKKLKAKAGGFTPFGNDGKMLKQA